MSTDSDQAQYRQLARKVHQTVRTTQAARSILVVMPAAPKRFVYVLESLADPSRHYTGITADVAGRLEFHNNGLSEHTAKMRPWQLLVSIEFADENRALRFEKYLKCGSGRAFAKRHFAA